MPKDNRTPNWSCIIYEDSVPNDYITQLEETGVEVCISPWHDMDVWTERDQAKNPEHVAGTPKKKHRHVVIMYGKGNKKSIDQVLEDFGFLNGTNFKRVKSVTGMIQYLTHKFCTTKHVYDERDVISLNGFDYDEVANTPTDKQTRLILKEMRTFIRVESIYDFCDFQDYVDENEELVTWSKVLDSNQYKIEHFITSRRCKLLDKKKMKSALAYQSREELNTNSAMEEGFDENQIYSEEE